MYTVTKEETRRITTVQAGQTIDLETWFQETKSASHIEAIEEAYEQWNDDWWHNEDNDSCDQNQDEDKECTCPEPEEDLVIQGRVWSYIKSEYQKVERVDHAFMPGVVLVQISVDDPDIDARHRSFLVANETEVIVQYEEEVDDPYGSPKTSNQQQGTGVADPGPLQPPKQAVKLPALPRNIDLSEWS